MGLNAAQTANTRRGIGALQLDATTDHVATITNSIDANTRAVTEMNESLKVLADCAAATLSFFKRFIPWAIAAIGVGYPAIGKVLDAMSKHLG